MNYLFGQEIEIISKDIMKHGNKYVRIKNDQSLSGTNTEYWIIAEDLLVED